VKTLLSGGVWSESAPDIVDSDSVEFGSLFDAVPWAPDVLEGSVRIPSRNHNGNQHVPELSFNDCCFCLCVEHTRMPGCTHEARGQTPDRISHRQPALAGDQNRAVGTKLKTNHRSLDCLPDRGLRLKESTNETRSS